jgi:toxin CptA
MAGKGNEKHQREIPTARTIRRACKNELYRAAKRLDTRLTDEQMEQAYRLYIEKVFANIYWIAENGNNRKLLADWWEENVCADIAALWNVSPGSLAKAFRDAFGG